MAIQQYIATLVLFGFIVNDLGFDGATENHSYLKQQLILSLVEAFPELFDGDCGEGGWGIGASPTPPSSVVSTKSTSNTSCHGT